jgi:tRNA G10  N-methylase Trm11
MDPWIRLRRSDLLDERPAGATEDVHFPERLAETVIARFSTQGELVLDPFAGYGTTAVVAARMGRRAIAVELLRERAELIRARLGDGGRVIIGDARRLRTLVREPIDLCFTSPPYMTRTGHPENPLTGYRTLDGEYVTYLDEMEAIAVQVAELLRPGAHFVVNAATIEGWPEPTELADDLADRISRHLVRRPDLPISWDEPPPGTIDDRCLVFVKSAVP